MYVHARGGVWLRLCTISLNKVYQGFPVVSHTGIVSTRFVTSGHMSLPPCPYLFLLSLHDRLVALSSTKFLFCYDKVLNIQCRPG